MQRCRACGRLRYPAAIVCPECLSGEAEWQAVSGRGKVFSFVVFHRAYHPAWEGRVPYNVALIELDEGPILLSNVIDVDNAKLAVGLDVQDRIRARWTKLCRFPCSCRRRLDQAAASIGWLSGAAPNDAESCSAGASR